MEIAIDDTKGKLLLSFSAPIGFTLPAIGQWYCLKHSEKEGTVFHCRHIEGRVKDVSVKHTVAPEGGQQVTTLYIDVSLFENITTSDNVYTVTVPII